MFHLGYCGLVRHRGRTRRSEDIGVAAAETATNTRRSGHNYITRRTLQLQRLKACKAEN